MFVDRRRNRPVRYLEWRIRLFGAGAIVGIVGIFLDTPWLIWVAIVILIVGFLLRFLPGEDEGDEAEEGEQVEQVEQVGAEEEEGEKDDRVHRPRGGADASGRGTGGT